MHKRTTTTFSVVTGFAGTQTKDRREVYNVVADNVRRQAPSATACVYRVTQHIRCNVYSKGVPNARRAMAPMESYDARTLLKEWSAEDV
jgi:hypothetical protein